MDLLPAIDIRQGRVVRLSQGEPGRETAYSDDPIAQAERFVAAGARWLHVVDLDRAFGRGENTEVISRLVSRVGARVKVQVAGGVRTLETARAVLVPGVSRIVLGTAAVTAPALVEQLVAEAGTERVAVGLDARDGFVAIRGWTETSDLRVDVVAREVLSAGARTLIYTDIGRDGMLTGPDLAGAGALASLGADVIASGGVASLDDLRAVRAAGLAGVIIGRALYEGRFTLEEALECA